MKRILLMATLISAATLANADCMDVVHKFTLAPVNEMKVLGTDADGITTVVRYKSDAKVLFGVAYAATETSTTTFQCDGKGHYRQFLTTLPAGWSQWRNGKEWNAEHWITF